MYNPVGEGFALAEMLFQLSANLAGDEDKRYFLQMYFPSHFKFGMEEIAKSINARMEMDMDLDMDDLERTNNGWQRLWSFTRVQRGGGRS